MANKKDKEPDYVGFWKGDDEMFFLTVHHRPSPGRIMGDFHSSVRGIVHGEMDDESIKFTVRYENSDVNPPSKETIRFSGVKVKGHYEGTHESDNESGEFYLRTSPGLRKIAEAFKEACGVDPLSK